MKTIISVAPGETITHRGDLRITQDVGKGATVIVENGSLIIEGNVERHANLHVSVSEETRRTSAVCHLESLGTKLTFGGTTLKVQSTAAQGRGSYTFSSLDVSAFLVMGDTYVGNVKINNRIYTDDTVISRGNNIFEIVPTAPSMNFFASSSSSADSKPAGITSATIDGVTYKGTKIIVNGSKVNVEGSVGASPAPSSSTAAPEEETISTPKLQVKGRISRFVTINSDAPIEADVISKKCSIKSPHEGITATTIGTGTIVEVHGAIKVSQDIQDDCQCKSTSYGIDFGRLGDRVTIDVHDAIKGGDIGDACVLKSKQYGLTADNLGTGVRVEVSDAISVGNIGADSHLSSRNYGLNAAEVADLVTIQVSDAIKLKSIGSNCTITSKNYGITVEENVGSHCTLTCSDDIHLNSLGAHSTLTSKQKKIKVRGTTGNDCIIQAQESIHLHAVGDNVRVTSSNDEVTTRDIGSYVYIKARGDIEIDGTSPNPSSCTFTTKEGKVTKPQKTASAQSSSQAAPSISLFKVEALKASSSIEAGAGMSNAPNAKPNTEEPPEHLCCPITLDLMTEPVICILDGITYERSAITKWLSEHKETPSRNRMQELQKISDVLIPNRAIVSAIEEYKSALTASVAPKA
ncbi:MAG: U-box domain-containing protein [Legionella sp.]|uniref:U-box domain-containing protein n=1 Tax=Legionella sp. TaxID=459 RepID=UPI00283ABA1E|nr:U-box domain-containing protein [Legionella sp.]